MATKYKSISFVDRMNNPAHRVKVIVERPVRSELISVQTYDDTLKRVVKRSEFRTIDTPKRFENLKFSDFAFENLLAIGFKPDSKSIKMSKQSLNIVDNIPSSSNN